MVAFSFHETSRVSPGREVAAVELIQSVCCTYTLLHHVCAAGTLGEMPSNLNLYQYVRVGDNVWEGVGYDYVGASATPSTLCVTLQ